MSGLRKRVGRGARGGVDGTGQTCPKPAAEVSMDGGEASGLGGVFRMRDGCSSSVS